MDMADTIEGEVRLFRVRHPEVTRCTVGVEVTEGGFGLFIRDFTSTAAGGRRVTRLDPGIDEDSDEESFLGYAEEYVICMKDTGLDARLRGRPREL